MPLSVTVITRNESANIDRALASVAWADEIIVVDAGSSDDTVALARRHTDRVEVRDWPGYSAQKNYAASIASHDWIFSLDADEEVSPELAAEVRTLLASEPARRGYRVPRVTCYLGRWIRSTDWYPDYQLRLYDRRAAEWNGRRVHESVRLRQGEPGRLRADLRHYAYRDISHHLATIDRYTTLAAEQASADGRRVSMAGIALHPPFAFLRNYVLRGGFRDGSVGFLVSALNSYYVFLKMAKTWELEARPGRGPSIEPGPEPSREPGPEPSREPGPEPSREPSPEPRTENRAPNPEPRTPNLPRP